MATWKNKTFFLVFLFSVNAFPYGKTGHRIVAELGFRHLTPKAKKEVLLILGKEKMSHAALWADEIKSDKNFDYAKPYHRMDTQKGSDITKIEFEKDSIIWALVSFEDVLRSKEADSLKKKEALKFILHLMGDLHQPLHIGYTEDQGGNRVLVKWFSKNLNLHQVWDEALIDFEQLSFTEYTDKLDVMDKLEIEKAQAGTYFDWAIESHSYLPLVYEIDKNLGYKYHYNVKDALNLLLQKAGIRLAFTLNKIFEDKPLTDSEKDLRKKLNL